MEINLNFDTEKRGDIGFARALGAALMLACDLAEGKEVHKPDVNPEPEQVVEPAPQPEPEPVEESPKKRSSRKKKEEPKPEPTQEELPLDNTSDLPFDNEPEQETTAEPVQEPEQVAEPEQVTEPEVVKNEFPKMTKDEWAEVNKAKREELGLTVEGAHANLIREFNIYCQKQSDLFWGTSKPSSLPEDKLWQFAEWFKTIQLNDDYVPGSADSVHGCPFVSNAPSNE